MLNAQRGQTIPFWLVTMVVLLSMFFFLTSYVNTIAWHIKAQNAADSAASTILSPSTNVLNQESTLLYAQAVNEYRIRYLNQGILNAINHVGCSSAAACQTVYTSLLTEYNASVNAYNDVNQLIQEANNFTQGGQIAADEKAAQAALGQGASDPAFTYTVFNSGPASGKGKRGALRQVDLGACARRTYFAPQLLGLASNAYFEAFGRAAAASQPRSAIAAAPAGWFLAANYSEYFKPGTTTNPDTSAPYQPVEDPSSMNESFYKIDFSSLTVGLAWYIGGTIQPYAGTKVAPKDYTCTQ